MIKLIKFNNIDYPLFQSEGNAAQFAIPYAKHVCSGIGFDIGCNRKEWSFPGATPIDKSFNDGRDALQLNVQENSLDYIFSSHCLEHIYKWIDALDYWTKCLKKGGILFLYLPDYTQEYWRPWNNRKHLNVFTPEIIYDYMIVKKYVNIFKSGVDLNNSFMIFGEKGLNYDS